MLVKRNVFLGCHTTWPVKNQMEKASIRMEMSMSEYIHTAIMEKLQHEGVVFGDGGMTLVSEPASPAA